MKKYSDELRAELKEKFNNGATYADISREYGIHYKTIETILQEDTSSEKRNVNKSLFSTGYVNKSDIDQKNKDAATFTSWAYMFSNKLKKIRLYNNLPVVYVGDKWFAYKTANGYTKTQNFIDIYNSKRA